MQLGTLLATAGLAAVATVNVALWTLRVALAAHGRRIAASATASVEAVLFVVAFTRVAEALDDPVRVIAYTLGVAAGTFAGLTIEEHASASLGRDRSTTTGGLRSDPVDPPPRIERRTEAPGPRSST